MLPQQDIVLDSTISSHFIETDDNPNNSEVESE